MDNRIITLDPIPSNYWESMLISIDNEKFRDIIFRERSLVMEIGDKYQIHITNNNYQETIDLLKSLIRDNKINLLTQKSKFNFLKRIFNCKK
jgi:uncharacterized ferritin-like protein (DUF455 family)